MDICYLCGEFKKVRKKYICLYPTNRYSTRYYTDWLYYFSFGVIGYRYICENCEKAKIIQLKKAEEKYMLEEEQEKKDWIKQRNELLKELKK